MWIGGHEENIYRFSEEESEDLKGSIYKEESAFAVLLQ